VRKLLACLVLGAIGWTLGAGAAAAQAAEKEDAAYQAWARVKPGTVLVQRVTTTSAISASAEGDTTREEETWRLIEVAPEQVTLECRAVRLAPNEAVIQERPVRTEKLPAHPASQPAAPTVKTVDTGQEEIVIEGQKLKSHWVKTEETLQGSTATRIVWTVDEPQMLEVGGQKLRCQLTKNELKAGLLSEATLLWTCPDVPGGTVRKLRERIGPGVYRVDDTVVRRFGVAAGEDPVSKLAAELQACWDGHIALQAKVRTLALAGDAAGTPVARGTGTYELKKVERRVQVRIEVTTEDLPPAGTTQPAGKTTTLQVIDGEFAYLLGEINGVHKARKTNIDPRDTGEPRAVLGAYRGDHELDRQPDATVDGRKAYVVAALLKTAEPEQRQRVLMYFDQVTGFLLQVERYRGGPKPVNTFTLTDVKYDEELPDEHFRFKAPEGVTVEDALTR
jgi:hypothetical protein